MLSGVLDITNSFRRIPGHDKSSAAGTAASLIGSDSYEEEHDSLHQFDGGFSDDDDDGPAGISLDLAESDSTEPGSMDLLLHSSSDGHSQFEAGESSEVEGGDETSPGDLIRVDSQLADEEDTSPDWAEVSMPGGYSSSNLYDVQIDSVVGVKKVKLHHPGTLPAFQQALPKSAGPAFPALHLSASQLRFFDANSRHEPSVYCSDILSFQWPMYYATHPAIDRLNLTQYVPELGIVVIGTQIGRVAICSLTRKGPKGPFGLRVDWILPFQSQEKTQERPLTHLLGIAVGPVHGHQLSRFSSVSEDDEIVEGTWLQDRIDEDGVSITFDPDIVRLNEDSSGNSNNRTTEDFKKYTTGKSSRKKPRGRAPPVDSTKRTRVPSPKWSLEKQAWPSRSQVAEASSSIDEHWRGIEYSRRYRLMLTYYDQTVMTYELSRQAPFVGDPAARRPNWRNREEYG